MGASSFTSRMSGWKSPWPLTIPVILSLYSLFLRNSLKGIDIFTLEISVCKLKVGAIFSTYVGASGLTSFILLPLFAGSLHGTCSFGFSLPLSSFRRLVEGWFGFNLSLLKMTSLLLSWIFLLTSSMACRYPHWYCSDSSSSSFRSSS